MLTNHRRALWYALGLLLAMGAVVVGVGVHPSGAAPATTVAFIGDWDLSVYHWMDDVRNEPLTFLARFLSVIGGGAVTIPLRLAVGAWLAVRTRWRALIVWLATWAAAEALLGIAKPMFHRGRPTGALVETVGYSFPSGHAVAGAAIAVALVLVLMPPGPARRRWEWAAAGFAFVMGSSRVYLHAHWLSDVVAGVLLGAGVAVGIAAISTRMRDRALQHLHHDERSPTDAEAAAPV
ncbi:MAG: phosphatase PAP2 family protein [Actinomycetota bacterium]